MACRGCKPTTTYRENGQTWLNRFREGLAEIIAPKPERLLGAHPSLGAPYGAASAAIVREWATAKHARLGRALYQTRTYHVTNENCPKCGYALIFHNTGPYFGKTECSGIRCDYITPGLQSSPPGDCL